MRIYSVLLAAVSIVAATVGGLTGCALSPQTVAVLPVIDVRAEPIGRGRVMALEVTDQRPQQTLGVRGGVYDTATINSRTDIVQGIRRALAERLQASGFQVAEPGTAAELGLQVVVRSIDYTPLRAEQIGAPLINEVKVNVIIGATARNAGLSRSGQYQATSTHRQLGYPNANDNELMINEVVSRALQQLLQDRSMVELLAQ